MTKLRVSDVQLTSAASGLRSAGVDVTGAACYAPPDFGSSLVSAAFERVDAACAAASSALSLGLRDLGDRADQAAKTFDAADGELAGAAG